MEDVGSTTTIFSLTTPGVTFLDGQAARDMARKVNEYCAELRDKNPSKFGFFATLPSLLDTEGAIAEISYALSTLKAEGVIVFTRYGDDNCYLGDPRLRPVWGALNAQKAVVLVHPCLPRDRHPFPATLLKNITEFPHETTRTAVDLIFSNTKRDHPDCKIILSHAGGTLPYLIGRISLMELLPYASVHKTKEEIFKDAKSFYYDLTLSGHDNVLRSLFGFVPEHHILFGTDYPFCPRPGTWRMNDGWESFTVSAEQRDMVNFRNAEAILPRYQQERETN
jgi:predicted TIM-barrel fold metal-dependent hydrolase